MNERDLKLDKFGIDRDLYRELKYYCLQYNNKMQEVNAIRGLSCGAMDAMPRGTDTSDPTSRKAERALKLRQDMEHVEQAAIQADCDLYQYIIWHVTTGKPFALLKMPCGERQFWEKRRMFFYYLAKRMGKL